MTNNTKFDFFARKIDWQKCPAFFGCASEEGEDGAFSQLYAVYMAYSPEMRPRVSALLGVRPGCNPFANAVRENSPLYREQTGI